MPHTECIAAVGASSLDAICPMEMLTRASQVALWPYAAIAAVIGILMATLLISVIRHHRNRFSPSLEGKGPVEADRTLRSTPDGLSPDDNGTTRASSSAGPVPPPGSDVPADSAPLPLGSEPRQARLQEATYLDLALHEILEQSLALVGGERGAVVAYSGDPTRVSLRISIGHTGPDDTSNGALPLTRYAGILERVYQQGGLIQEKIEGENGPGGMVAALPLQSADTMVGAMLLEGRALGDEEGRLLAALGDMAAVAMLQEELYRSEQRKRAVADTLVSTARLVRDCPSVDDLLGSLLDELQHVVPYQGAAIMLRGDDWSAPLQVASYRGDWLTKHQQGCLHASHACPIPAAVLDRRQPVLVSDVTRDADWPLEHDGGKVGSFMGVPLLGRREVLGVLGIASDTPRAYTQLDLELATSFADQAAVVIDKAMIDRRIRRRFDEVAALNEMARAITSMKAPQEILQFIMDQAQLLFDSEAASIALIDDDGQSLTFQVAVAAGAEETVGQRIAIGQGIAGWVAQHGQAVRVDDVTQDERFFPGVDEKTGVTTRNLMCVPMIVDGRVIGVVEIVNRRAGGAFSDDDLALLEAIGAQAGTAIDRSRLYMKAARRADQLATLLETGLTITSTLELQAVLEMIADRATRLLASDGCTLYLLDEERAFLQPVVALGSYTEEVLRFPIHIDQGLSGWVARNGRGRILNPADSDPVRIYVPGIPHDPQSLISVPLRTGTETIGVMTINKEGDHEFSEEDLYFLSTLATQASIAIANARLYQKARDSYEERDRAYRELEETQHQLVQTEKLSALGQMASGIAHNFNNTLAVVLGRAQLALHGVEGEGLRRDLEAIIRAARDGATTVRRLQEFTRLHPNEKDLSTADLNEIVETAAEITRPRWRDQMQAEGHNVQLILRQEPIPKVAGNPAELREVLTNMIFNALDAMPEGGQIILQTRALDDQVAVSIQDTGVGMSEDVKSRIFDPFFTTKGPQNSGLGLSTSYGIIVRHGGEIRVESGQGVGTTFTITLPATEEIQPVEEARNTLAPAVPGRILVVDDEPDLASVVERMLRDEGHEVVTCADANEALEAFRASPFDLVITDLGMPGMSGWDLVACLRETGSTVPVVMITGWGDSVDEHLLEKHQIKLVIPKPFDILDLLDATAEILRGQYS